MLIQWFFGTEISVLLHMPNELSTGKPKTVDNFCAVQQSYPQVIHRDFSTIGTKKRAFCTRLVPPKTAWLLGLRLISTEVQKFITYQVWELHRVFFEMPMCGSCVKVAQFLYR